MAVYRTNEKKDFTIISNQYLKNRELSLKAKGLLTLMLSLPSDWKYSEIGLIKLSKDGKESVRAAVKELETNNYLKRCRKIDKNGRFRGYEYYIYEKPSAAGSKQSLPGGE